MTGDYAVWVFGRLNGCESVTLAWDHGGQVAPPGAFPATQSSAESILMSMFHRLHGRYQGSP